MTFTMYNQLSSDLIYKLLFDVEKKNDFISYIIQVSFLLG